MGWGQGGGERYGGTASYRQVRDGASALRVVEPVGAIWWRVVCEPVVHGCGLVVGEREDVAEASAGVNDCFARFFGLRAGGEGFGDVCVVFDLEEQVRKGRR